MAAQSDVLISSLYDDGAVTAVLDTMLSVDLTGKLIMETSTVAPTCLTDRIGAIEAKGGAAVDAPISGGPEMVAAGTCGVFIGGTDAAANRALKVLAPLTERRFHVGPLGSGMVMKTLNNAMMQVYVAGLRDLLPMAKRAGLPLETAMTILSNGPAGMAMIKDRLPKILGEDDTVGFPMAGVHKDNAVFARVVEAYGLTSEVLALAGQGQAEAIEAGLGDKDPAAAIASAYHNG